MKKDRPIPQKRPMGGPPGRGKRGGPPAMPPCDPEDAMIIMPNFLIIRDAFFRLVCIFVVLSLFIEGAYFFSVYYNDPTQGESLPVFLIRLGISSGLNLIILWVAIMFRKKLPDDKSCMPQNFIPVFAMMTISMITSIIHCDSILILSVYCLPIFMTAAYTNKEFCLLITRFCMIGVAISIIRHVIITDGSRLSVIMESLIMVLILVIALQITLSILTMTSEQRDKLYDFSKKIREEQHQSQAANRAKSEFLANMSHEIRTPINAILGMDEMILRENEDPQINDYAENIYSASTSLLYLVNDVLDISKIESGRMEITESTYDTASLVHDCCNMITEKLKKKKLDFQVYCNPNLPSLLKGDDMHIRQIVTNILSNAVKYTEKGTVTLSVDKQQSSPDSFSLTFMVKDTGIGIKEEDIPGLFSQFTRFDMKKNRTIEGTGLGLSITKQLIDLMKGEIRVESTYGSGSTFTVILPQQIVDNTPIGNFHDRYQEVSQKNNVHQKKFEAPNAHILVVDDVEVNLKVVVNLLKQTKIKVDTAISGKVCLEKVQEIKYDLIFMDHMMPEMNGIETYHKMKEMNTINQDTPVIMLTANAITGVRDEYMQAGFSDYLTKPILGNKLETMIAKYLPADKIINRDTADEEDDTEEAPGKSNLMRLQDLYQAYPHIDMEEGMKQSGEDAASYLNSLREGAALMKNDAFAGGLSNQKNTDFITSLKPLSTVFQKNGCRRLAELTDNLIHALQESDAEVIAQLYADFLAECQQFQKAMQALD